MRAELYWISDVPEGRLAIMPRPRSGDWLADEIASSRQAGLDVVVSLLPPDEVAELGLEAEPELCRVAGLLFVSFPIPDRGVPCSRLAFEKFVARLDGQLRVGKAVGIHCRIGVGRSALVAARLLALQGQKPEEAFEVIGRCRGQRVPDTEDQVQWVESLGRKWRGSGESA